ncbi:hypothetical protein H4R34_006168, partial [Dimargaris verticillata]
PPSSSVASLERLQAPTANGLFTEMEDLVSVHQQSLTKGLATSSTVHESGNATRPVTVSESYQLRTISRPPKQTQAVASTQECKQQ